MSSTDDLPPGTPAPISGQYEIVGSDGRGTGVERTGVKDKPLPPTPNPGELYRQVDPTKNRSGYPDR